MSTVPLNVADPQSLSAEEFVTRALAHVASAATKCCQLASATSAVASKHRWISGRHGYDHQTATADEIRSWPALVDNEIASGKPGILSLGLVLPPDVEGFDVDAYDDKRGLETLKSWSDQWGQLPDTYIVTARHDKSGIRLYRKPIGWTAREIRDSGVDFIDHYHRYIIAPCSWHHSGELYRLVTPSYKRRKSGIVAESQEFPELPAEYLDGLALPTNAVGGSGVSLAEFLSKHTASAYPGTLNGVVNFYRDLYKNGREGKCVPNEPHNAMKQALDMGFNDAAKGYLNAQAVYDAVLKEWKREGRPLSEFNGMASWHANRSENLDAAKTSAKAMRDYGLTQVGFDPQDLAQNPIRALSTVKRTAVQWLWYGWIPLGKVCILEGDSDGKSTITLTMAAIVSQGKPWPLSRIGTKSVASISDPATVVLVGIEDDDSDTVVPRLVAAGADLERVFKLERAIDGNGDPKPFTIPDDVDWLRKAIVQGSGVVD